MTARQVSSVLITPNNNLSSKDWLLGVVDNVNILSLDVSGNSLFTGNFVPPPPRPLFLDEGVTPDGLTTCDLCSWAWRSRNSFTKDASLEPPSELGWMLTLVIVSLISAVVGAVIMIIALQCKRLKKPSATNGADQTCSRPPIETPDDKVVSHQPPQSFPNNGGVWSWLSRRSATPSQLENSPISFVENHYTHMEDAYNATSDALYAELDVEAAETGGSPAYQNSAYTDPDAPSAPSSAYYSDLSTTTVPDRAYEVVGLATVPVWEPAEGKKSARLAAISETVTVPSDYV